MCWVFEPCNVENEGRIRLRIVSAYRREVSVARLSECSPTVRDRHEATRSGRRSPEVSSELLDSLPPLLLCRSRRWRSVCFHRQTVATCKTRHLVKGEAVFLDRVDGSAAVQQRLVVEPPGTFPIALRVDTESVENHGQARQAAPRYLVLGDPLGRQGEESFQRPVL